MSCWKGFLLRNEMERQERPAFQPHVALRGLHPGSLWQPKIKRDAHISQGTIQGLRYSRCPPIPPAHRIPDSGAHTRSGPVIQVAQPDRLLPSPEHPRPYIPTPHAGPHRRCVLHNNMALCCCRDAACCVSAQRLCNRTRPCNCTTTMSLDYESSFEGGQPCERVQRSKAGGCSHTISNSNPAHLYLTPPHKRHSREGGRERSDRRSKSRQRNLQDLLSSEPRENPPSKGDSLANTFSRARQGDVYSGQHYRYAPNTPRVSPHTARNTGQPTRKHVLPPTPCLAPPRHPGSTT